MPAAVTLYAQGETGMAVFLVVWCVVLVAGSDNVIKPLIISGNSNARPGFWVAKRTSVGSGARSSANRSSATDVRAARSSSARARAPASACAG